MFHTATIAALTPFLLGLAQASPAPVRPRFNIFPLLLVPNFPVPLSDPPPDPSPAPLQVQDASSNVTILDHSTSALTAVGPGDPYFSCNPYNDATCYKYWWDYYRYCHPYDRRCYRDWDNYDDYEGHCKNWDSAYGKCYDKCYYDHDNCDKYKDCNSQDDSCYKKKREDDYCHPPYDGRYDEHCKHEPPEDYCRPYDYDCHREKPGYGKPDKPDDGYKCHPYKDKDCYPGYPDHDGGYYDPPHKPNSYVTVRFYNKKQGLLSEQKVWPDGEELYTRKWLSSSLSTDINFPSKSILASFRRHLIHALSLTTHLFAEHKNEWVEYIKYYVEKEDKNVRCLPMKNWFPWNPLAIYSYAEKDEYGYKVRSIELKKPQPVEVIRCDFP